jgi:predicted glycoside hydrolase/deacetylase ChbG (UPF0249 family)
MDEVNVVVEVRMSFFVTLSVGPSSPLSGDKFKEALIEQVKNHIDAGGLVPGHIDSHSIVELRNSADDALLLGA